MVYIKKITKMIGFFLGKKKNEKKLIILCCI